MSLQSWMLHLPQADREQFLRECTVALSTARATGRLADLADLLDDWRNTAELYADPHLVESLGAPIAEPLDLPIR